MEEIRGDMMKRIKKISAVILISVFMSLFVPSEAVSASDGLKPVIQVQDQIGKAGETVEMDIVVTGNTGIAGATLQVEYDAKLTLQQVKNGDALSQLTFTQPAKLESPSKFLWDSEQGMSKQDGTMLILQFLISENVTEGEELPVHISYVAGDIFDENLEDVNLQLLDGTIRVQKEENKDCSTIGHTPGEPSEENQTRATCQKEGSYDLVIKCTKCGEVLSSKKVMIPKKDHKIVIDAAVKPTYTREGLTQGKHCSVCKKVLVKQKKVAKLAKKNAKITVLKKNFTCKAKDVKKKKQAVKINAKVSGNGKITYKKISGSKNITVSKTGKVIVKKGTKKGVYKFKVQIHAADSTQYKAKTEKVTFQIKIK